MKCENVKYEKIPLLLVDNGNGLRVYFSAMGASLYSIYYDNELMTLTPTHMKDFLRDNIYNGKTIGPVCGRIKDGQINIDDLIFEYEKNEGNNTLHSGKSGLSNTIFSKKIYNTPNLFSIMFSFTNKEKIGKEKRITKYFITYVITSDNRIIISYKVTSNKPIVLSLTNNVYFTLGESNIEKLKMRISADSFVEFDKDDLTPLSYHKIIPCLDFNYLSPLTKEINNPYLIEHKTKGIDHFFLFNKDNKQIILESNKYRLTIKTNLNGVQIYTDNYSDNVEMLRTINSDRRGVAIEPQDSPLERKIYCRDLKDIYDKEIEYQFERK